MDEPMKDDEDATTRTRQSKLSFLLRPPVTKEEVGAAAPRVCKTINSAYDVFESKGVDALLEYIRQEGSKNKSRRTNRHDEGENSSSDSDSKSGDDDAIVKGNPRRYQIELVEIAKKQNTIVQLHTGLGKTLIAIMMIRHFSSEYQTTAAAGGHSKQTWFLVPSVALAVQQTKTLQVNLPFKVATVCHTGGKSDSARAEFSAADILVLTHGSALELLQHYNDTFNLSRVNLIVVDECHHATKNHNYKHIFTQFYHTLDVLSRPRVLGLTATPIINVEMSDSEDDLEIMLRELEYTLDSTIVGFSSLGLSLEESGIISNNMKELSVFYDQPPIPVNSGHFINNYASLHKSRIKELEKLDYLLQYGEAVVYRYCQALCREISHNYYEKESAEQFAAIKAHLVQLTDHFKSITLRTGGKSIKLMELEKLLLNLYGAGINGKSSFKDTIGIVFVQCRISAVSLKHYFSSEFADLNDDNQKNVIRSGLLTRKTTHVFKYLSSTQKMNKEEQEKARKDWLHTVQDTRKILNSLRSREINLLFATPVVEEGVDVDACSFVIVLDGLQTTKTYVQMKGRARQLDANFYVFENTNSASKKPPLTLSQANAIDSKVSSYLGSRREGLANGSHKSPQGTSLEESILDSFISNEASILASAEEEALMNGIYRAPNGMVDLLSSKSLVNRYCSCIPMDIHARSSRVSMTPYLPIYKDTRLALPSHLPLHVRNICLPQKFWTGSKKKNEKLLALIACVRLHELNVLNHRLLPLKREDIQKKLCITTLKSLKPSFVKAFEITPPTTHQEKEIFIYPLIQRGAIFDQNMKVLKGERKLCIISMCPLASASNFSLQLVHKSLRTVYCTLDSPKKETIDHSQWKLCTLFYTTLINSRWRRRTGLNHFKFFDVRESIFAPYLVSCLNNEHLLDWDYMRVVVAEYNRNEDERMLAAKNWSGSTPRLFAPRYDPNNTYIALQIDQNQNCSSPFPKKGSGFASFSEYFLKKWSCKVSDDCNLVNVQRCWDLPTKTVEVDNKTDSRSMGQISNDEVGTTCKRLASVLLPQDLCLETPLADPSLFLNCVMLPQILHELESSETIHNFIKHCSQWPILYKCLEKIPFENVTIAMTAKSCAFGDISYDRLEYLGDAVLKLIHTDALINSKDEELKCWFHCLHEGDLTELRTAMGSNDRLKDISKAAGFDAFILTRPLGRGTWEPVGLERYVMDDVRGLLPIQDKRNFSPSSKAMADVVESILGLIYEHCGYEAATEVALELDISTPRLMNSHHQMNSPDCTIIDHDLIKKAISFLGVENIEDSGFIMEACTHPSKTNSSNYQRLEWIGDAVLCLAAREWCYKHFPSFTVKNLVTIETILICNETLSRVAFSSGLHKHILHCDSTLPGRLEAYAFEIEEKHQGLWATDPPKVLADVVEALIGVAHIDGGLAQGQKAAKNAISTMIASVEEHFANSDQKEEQIMTIMHPVQAATELCPVKVRSLTMNDYKREYSSEVWFGDGWDYCSDDICYGNIGRITYFGLSLCEVANKNSRSVAAMRSSSLFTSILNDSEDLQSKLDEMTEALNQRTKTKN